jgi:diadenosine tetraphosphate (Ap4A) HIT family hydrolase
MSKWNSAEWASLCSGDACPICRQSKPNGIVLELSTSYLTSSADAPIRGYCCLVLKRHAVELHELRDEEAISLMRDIRRVGRALEEIIKPVKLNYEIHGNTIPHLHAHLYPRYRGDPFEGRSIEPSLITTSPYKGAEFEDFVAELQRRLRLWRGDLDDKVSP